PGAGLVDVRREAVEAHSEIGTEAGAAGIEPLQDSALEQMREELLGNVLGVLGRQAPRAPEMLVDGSPVGGDQRFPGLATHVRVGCVEGADDGVAGGWERSDAGTRRRSVWSHGHAARVRGKEAEWGSRWNRNGDSRLHKVGSEPQSLRRSPLRSIAMPCAP